MNLAGPRFEGGAKMAGEFDPDKTHFFRRQPEQFGKDRVERLFTNRHQNNMQTVLANVG